VGISFVVWVDGQDPAVSVDGEVLARGALEVLPGAHVLGFEVVDAPSTAFVMTRMSFSPSLATAKVHHFISEAGPSWRYTLEDPGPGWRELDFDDSGWDEMVAGELAPPSGQDPMRAIFERDVPPIGIGRSAPRVWIRARFQISPRGFA
jgi:hypothetical protein